MPNLPITSFTAAAFAFMIVALGLQVSLRRVKLGGINFGDGGDSTLQRRIRAHGNFIEYAPLGLACTALLEFQSAPHNFVIAIAVCFVATRLLHAIGMLYSESPLIRAIAMMLQHLNFLAAGAYLAYNA